MSQNNDTVLQVIRGEIDYFNLFEFPRDRYFFELSHQPISSSVIYVFDQYNGRLSSEGTIVKLVNEADYDQEVNDIQVIPYTSIDADTYAKSLIGVRTVINREWINIDSSNYLEYKFLLEEKIFVDFSVSEKIINILQETDEFGNRLCTNFTATYFYDLQGF